MVSCIAQEGQLPLPTVDLGANSDAAVAAQLRTACCDHGFFLISNHGVPEDSLRRVLDDARAFFALPDEAKVPLYHNAHAKGYQPWAEQTLDYASQTTPDSKETWAIMDAGLSAAEDGRPFVSENKWPQQNLLPQFKPNINSFFAEMQALRDRVNRLMALALGQPLDFFDPCFKQQPPLDMLRLFHYHCERGSSAAEGRLGAGAHSDWGSITYLLAGGPGLEVWYKGAWLAVPNVPGTFICNIGDLLQLWSGGLFKATKHRVLVAPGVHRYSCAYFTVPAWQTLVKPLPALHMAAEGGGQEAAGSSRLLPAAGGAADGDAPTAGNSSSGGLVVLDSGEMLLGAKGVRVLDYISAKFDVHVNRARRPPTDATPATAAVSDAAQSAIR